jgi:hypothetical protein
VATHMIMGTARRVNQNVRGMSLMERSPAVW